MKRIIIIAVLAYLVYYLYNKKNAGAAATMKEGGPDPNLVGGNLDSTYGPGNYLKIEKTNEELFAIFVNQIRLKKRLTLTAFNKGKFKEGDLVRLVNSKLYQGTYKIEEVNVIMSQMPGNYPDSIILNTPYLGDESGLIMVRQNTTSQAEPSLVDPVGTSNANIAALQPLVKKFKGIDLSPIFLDLRPEDIRYAAPQIVEERTPALTGDTPYWMPNGEEMIYPRGLEYNTF